MQWSDLPLNPSTRTLRQFAGLWIVFFGGIALWQYAAHARTELAITLAVVAFTLGPAGLLFPALLRPVFIAWLTLAFPIGWVVSRVLLMTLFWGVMTPMGVTSRLFGRDLLRLRRQRDVATYWRPKDRARDMHSYFRQF